MGVNWTKEQTQVINSRERNLLVSAAAGSGKTAVLVERIIQMVTDERRPVDIDRLLVMTFTKAAAAEMRERIQAALEKRLEENPQNEHLQQQAVMVQYAQITTIDSFCLHILREHFDRLTIDPAFRVGDEGEMLLMKSDVMDELLEDYYAKEGSGFERFVNTYATGKADGGISDYINQVYTFSQSNPWPEEWFDKCILELSRVTLEELEQTEWMKFLLHDIRIQAEEWAQQLEAAISLCREEDGPQPYLPMLCEDLYGISRLTDIVSYETFCKAADQIVFPKLAAIRASNTAVSPEKKDAVSDCRKRVKKAVEKMREQYLFESLTGILKDLEDGSSAVLMLLELAREFSIRFRQKKQEKNVVDFNDLEHFALEILMEEQEENGRIFRLPGVVANEISGQYDEILVDEYQDSNLVQETLITCVSRERSGHPNVFMVGDVKQSIYKFRLARPELFLDKYHSYSSEEGLYQKIELHQNFRSRDTVLKSINEVFERIMTRKLGDIDYTEETALHPGITFADGGSLEQLDTELLLINTAGSVLEQLDDDVSDYTGRELEAGMVAGKIRELTEENPFHVWDKEKECYRPARYSDIVILLRSVSGWADTFTEVLIKQGIPAFAESRTGYFDASEVETVLNLLAVIDNPIQDIPLASVLKAPFSGLKDVELAHVTALYKNAAKKGRDRGLYGAVMNFLNPEIPDGQHDPGEKEQEKQEQKKQNQREKDQGAENRKNQNQSEENGGIFKKLKYIMGLVNSLRDAAVYLPIHELLYRIYKQTGFYDYVSAMPSGETRRANLDMLAEKAAAYEATSYRGVFHFIKYIEKLKRYNTDFGGASTVSEHGDTVRIMSIHKSKGLEFPIVFVAGMGKLFNKQDMRGKILIDSDYGIGTDYLDSEKRLKGPTLKKNVLKRKMELEALGEELRVLYVAMTRAKEKLILTASDKNPDARLIKWKNIFSREGKVPYTVLTTAGSYLDWVLMGLTTDNKFTVIKEIRAEALLNREIAEQSEKLVSKEELLHFDVSRTYDEKYRAKLLKSFEFTYPYAADLVLNTKLSVSELKKEGSAQLDAELAFVPTIPAFMEEEVRQEGGVSRGTAYHRIMELLPFGQMEAEKDVADYITVLVSRGKITEAAASLVQAQDIYRFLISDLGKRMAEAEKYGRLFREKQFVMGLPAREVGDWDSDEPVLIQGIIDAYFEEADGLVLVDYKTDYVKNEEILIRRYVTQLNYYERALVKIIKKPVKERFIYSYRLGSIRA